MTVQDLIEKLMEYPLDAEIVFQEMRYNGGGDEWYECDIDIWQPETHLSHVWITPSPDTRYVQQSINEL